jgi:hypothetical protein
MVMDGSIVGGGPKLRCVYLVEYRQNVNLPTIAEHLMAVPEIIKNYILTSGIGKNVLSKRLWPLT